MEKIGMEDLKKYSIYAVSFLTVIWVIGVLLAQVPILAAWISVFSLPAQVFSIDSLKLLIGMVIGLLVNDKLVYPWLEKTFNL